MAKQINSVVAKRLIATHEALLEELKKTLKLKTGLRDAVEGAVDALIAQEVMNVLKEIPIEELNRDKRGIRVKSLREYGYNTIADIAAASIRSITLVNGISREGAAEIKEIVNDIVAMARGGVKIQLSEDNKTKATTKLIVAISKYRRCRDHVKACEALHKKHQSDITEAVADLKVATGGIRWFFSSGAKKQLATAAYETLSALSEGGYLTSAREHIDAIEDALDTTTTEAWQDFAENSIQFFNILEDINPGLLGNDDTVYGLPEDLAREIQDEAYFPDGLLCELRRYQEWGVKYILHQEKVLLGDEMGLGKTIQAIAAMVSLKNTGATHFVVVCPASVLSNWCREIRKMSKLSVTKVHGNDKTEALEAWKSTGGVAVTTYETTAHFELEEAFKFSLLVVDEAHYIKNPEARRTKNVKEICQKAERLLFMTGTALENKVEEMISLMQILQPEVARSVKGMESLSAAPQFREKVAPVYYRRKREDVLTELPELIEAKEWCEMGAVEEAAYEEAVLSGGMAAARRVSWNVEDMENSSKAMRMMEIIEEAASEGRKVIVFSFFLDTISKVTELLGDKCYGPINGSVLPQKRQEIIDEFDAAPAGSVLAAQIQAGGTGLNIQSASVVIICEPQFKPSIENQAISRAYRMGQTRNVLVHRLLCEDTVDERITDLLEEKQQVFDAFADESVAADKSMELDEKTKANIIKGEIDRIIAKRGEANNGEEA